MDKKKAVSPGEIIALLTKAKSINDVFPDLTIYKDVYKEYAALIHPDVCSEAGAVNAMTILNKYKNELGIGTKYTSDGIGYRYAGDVVTITAEPYLINVMERNYNALMDLKGDNNANFQRYLPKSMKRDEDSLIFTCGRRVIPLHAIPQPVEQMHVNWMLSRMLEFGAWFNQIKYVNAGFNPDTIFTAPSDHGVVVLSLLHITPVHSKIATISGKFSGFYPAHMFVDKLASTDIDISLAKRTALWLLGDKSGVGNSLRKTHDQDIINFMQKTSYSPYDSYRDWRDMLKAKFEKKFHILNV